ncbi:MAG TPA: CBS domain-containing protein [Acidimicrobiales bacterium]|nr:CBS domain-containing protein [Acidimicrobiales bacterium]
MDVPTSGPDDDAGDVVRSLREAGASESIVVNAERVVLGLVDVSRFEDEEPSGPVADVMELSPTTIRPSVSMSELAEGKSRRALVTSSDGRLLGVAHPSEPEGHSDEAEADSRQAEIEQAFLETAEALAERFGDHEPTEDEVHAFLHERLMEEGRTADEADRILAGEEPEEAG